MFPAAWSRNLGHYSTEQSCKTSGHCCVPDKVNCQLPTEVKGVILLVAMCLFQACLNTVSDYFSYA